MSAAGTIAAIATAPGRAGIGVVRISGPATRAIAGAILSRIPAPRHATHAVFRDADGSAIDRGIALFFPAPHSYTGEDVLELQGHGGSVVLDLLLARALALGARPARPGEFSERAFLNGKLDLTQAEAVADLIEAGSAAAARSAMRSLAGEFSARVHEAVEALIALRSHVEAAIDFPEEEVDYLADAAILARLELCERLLAVLSAGAHQGRLLNDGMVVVLAGRPNVGKSSLLNRLARHEAAIVTAIPGTTRDVLRERIELDGMPVQVMDTAGLRETPDEVEREGVRRAQDALARADRVLLLIDDSAEDAADVARLRAELPAGVPVTLVYNKIDLSGRAPGVSRAVDLDVVALSAKTGAGIGALCEHLKTSVGYQAAGENGFIARRRHLDALARAADHLARSRAQLAEHRAGELAAEELRLAQRALNEITGEFTNEDLLGRIFASFCIGK